MPPILLSNVTATLDHPSDLSLQQGGPGLQTSAVNPLPSISAFLLQQDVLPLQTLAFIIQPCVLIPLLLRSMSRFNSEAEPLPPPSAVRAHDCLLSALQPQQVEPPLQPSAVNTSSLPIQRYMPLQPLYACDPPIPLSVSLQGKFKPPIIPSTV